MRSCVAAAADQLALLAVAAAYARAVAPRLLCTSSCATSMAAEAAAQPAAGAAQPEVIVEGKARVLKKGNDVFYNEAQVTNRDLSVAVLRHFLPQWAQETAAGKLKLTVKQRKQQNLKSRDKQGGAAVAAPAAAAAAAANGSGDDAAAPAAAGTSGGAGADADGGPAAAAAAAAAGQDAGSGEQQQQRPAARLLEGLAASGLRSVRYALELDHVGSVCCNDVDASVVESMAANIAFNGPAAQALVRPSCADARVLMLGSPSGYDVIDLDPYGTPVQFLDSVVQAVSEGGLLAVTATDMAVLCGNSGEVCWTKYGSYPVHRPYCHEGAVRILLACLEAHANRYKRYIVPLLSVHMDFYIRVFVRVYTSAAEVKSSASKLAYVWQSQGCDSWWLQPVGQLVTKGKSTKHLPGPGPAPPSNRCPETGAGFLMGGPIWARPIHDAAWVAGLLAQMGAEAGRYAQFARLKGILTSVLEELPDVPLYYSVHEMCRTVRCTPPKGEVLRSAFLNAGFRVSGSHANPLALKTDAPPRVVWDIIRSWVESHPVKPPEPGSYAAAILGRAIETRGDFRRAAGAVPASVKAGVPRFVQNPAYWGPKARHGKPLKAEQQRQQDIQAAQRRARQQAAGGDGDGGDELAAAAAAAAAAGGGSRQPHMQQQQQAADQQQQAEQQQQQQQQQEVQPLADVSLDDLYDAVEEQQPAGGGPPRKKARQEQQQPVGAGGG